MSGKRPYIKRKIGDRVGNLTLTERCEGGHLWLARCDCGEMVRFQVSSGQKMCAACSRKRMGEAMKVHGESPDKNKRASRLYRIWLTMRQRCRNKNVAGYKDYGGIGIAVCEEWSDYMAFKSWAMANGYSDDLSIDRIDVTKGYSPDNCRWATDKQQANNKRNNHLLTFNGKTATMAEWAETTGIPYHTLKSRINRYGFSAEEALTLPVCKGNNQRLRGEQNGTKSI